MANWLTTGAPSGIVEGYDQVLGLLPTCEEGDINDPFELKTDHPSFANYSGVEEDDEISAKIDG